jgi:glucose-1-phosphate adenylyltransferase
MTQALLQRYAEPHVFAILLAGGEGKRLLPLTLDRAKPAVPFGGHFRLIDFALSNLVNGGLRQIVALTQYKSHSLDVHLSLTWRLSPLLGNFVTTVPAQMRRGPRWFAGSADAMYQNLNLIEDYRPDYVVVFGSDHIYRMDPHAMIERHIESGAGVTVAAARQPRAEAHQFGVIGLGDGPTKIESIVEKPAEPVGLADAPDQTLASMGNYVFTTDVLAAALQDDADDPDSRHDVGGDLLPKLVAAGEAHAYDFSGNVVPGEVERGRHYWRDVGTLDSYYEAHMDLVSPLPLFDLYNPEWPIHTWVPSSPPAKIVEDVRGPAEISDTLLSHGVIVSGARVRRSVLSPGVILNAGAEVENAILLHDVTVGPGARVRNAIIDKNVHVPAGASIGHDRAADEARGFTISPKGIVAIAKNASLAEI